MKVVVEMDERDYNTMKNGFLVVGVTKGKPLDNVLDEIKAEIEREIFYKPIEMWDYRMGMKKALEIIDKYKAESEESE